MKFARIKQLVELERKFKADGYEVLPRINSVRNTLIIVIPLKEDNDKDLMAQWNDVKRVSG